MVPPSVEIQREVVDLCSHVHLQQFKYFFVKVLLVVLSTVVVTVVSISQGGG